MMKHYLYHKPNNQYALLVVEVMGLTPEELLIIAANVLKEKNIAVENLLIMHHEPRYVTYDGTKVREGWYLIADKTIAPITKNIASMLFALAEENLKPE